MLAAVLMAASGALAESSNWVMFAPKGPGFHMELPAQPAVNSGDVKTTHGPARGTFFFFKGANGLEGMVKVTDYQPGAISKDPRGFLDASREDYERRRPLSHESRFTVDGAPAQRFVTNTVDGRVARIQELVIGDRFISLVCFVPKGQESSEDLDRIFRSFGLAKP